MSPIGNKGQHHSRGHDLLSKTPLSCDTERGWASLHPGTTAAAAEAMQSRLRGLSTLPHSPPRC